MNLIPVNKNLGEQVTDSVRLIYSNTSSDKTVKGWYSIARKHYCDFLKKKGYAVSVSGNYIIATKGNETNTFFFAAHNNMNTNYLIPKVLKYEVQYFVFYDENKDCVYTLAYNKVRNYAKTIEKSIYFGARGEEKLRIPDKWAKAQVINTEYM